MYVQLASSCLEVNIAERLQSSTFQTGKFNKHTSVSCKALQIGMALTIQICAHFLYLKIGHIAYLSAHGAFMGSRAAELKTLYQTSRREHLAGCAYDLAKTGITGEDANNIGTAGNPDYRLVLFGL